VQELCPDIVLLDVAMPGMSGEQVALQLRQRAPGVKIIALSGHTERQFVRAMVAAGAEGYVVKSASGRELVFALRAVAAGQSYLSPEVTAPLMRPEGEHAAGGVPPAVLAPREREVLKLIAEGHRSARIASELGIAVGTVEAHRRNILRKLELHSVADLTRYALRHGLATQ
jgi:two-component system NarL family response regulator